MRVGRDIFIYYLAVFLLLSSNVMGPSVLEEQTKATTTEKESGLDAKSLTAAITELEPLFSENFSRFKDFIEKNFNYDDKNDLKQLNKYIEAIKVIVKLNQQVDLYDIFAAKYWMEYSDSPEDIIQNLERGFEIDELKEILVRVGSRLAVFADTLGLSQLVKRSIDVLEIDGLAESILENLLMKYEYDFFWKKFTAAFVGYSFDLLGDEKPLNFPEGIWSENDFREKVCNFYKKMDKKKFVEFVDNSEEIIRVYDISQTLENVIDSGDRFDENEREKIKKKIQELRDIRKPRRQEEDFDDDDDEDDEDDDDEEAELGFDDMEKEPEAGESSNSTPLSGTISRSKVSDGLDRNNFSSFFKKFERNDLKQQMPLDSDELIAKIISKMRELQNSQLLNSFIKSLLETKVINTDILYLMLKKLASKKAASLSEIDYSGFEDEQSVSSHRHSAGDSNPSSPSRVPKSLDILVKATQMILALIDEERFAELIISCFKNGDVQFFYTILEGKLSEDPSNTDDDELFHMINKYKDQDLIKDEKDTPEDGKETDLLEPVEDFRLNNLMVMVKKIDTKLYQVLLLALIKMNPGNSSKLISILNEQSGQWGNASEGLLKQVKSQLKDLRDLMFDELGAKRLDKNGWTIIREKALEYFRYYFNLPKSNDIDICNSILSKPPTQFSDDYVYLVLPPFHFNEFVSTWSLNWTDLNLDYLKKKKPLYSHIWKDELLRPWCEFVTSLICERVASNGKKLTVAMPTVLERECYRTLISYLIFNQFFSSLISGNEKKNQSNQFNENFLLNDKILEAAQLLSLLKLYVNDGNQLMCKPAKEKNITNLVIKMSKELLTSESYNTDMKRTIVGEFGAIYSKLYNTMDGLEKTAEESDHVTPVSLYQLRLFFMDKNKDGVFSTNDDAVVNEELVKLYDEAFDVMNSFEYHKWLLFEDLIMLSLSLDFEREDVSPLTLKSIESGVSIDRKVSIIQDKGYEGMTNESRLEEYWKIANQNIYDRWKHLADYFVQIKCESRFDSYAQFVALILPMGINWRFKELALKYILTHENLIFHDKRHVGQIIDIIRKHWYNISDNIRVILRSSAAKTKKLNKSFSEYISKQKLDL